MPMIEVTLASNATRPVEASSVRGQFAVHRPFDLTGPGWAVTHLPTGLKVAHAHLIATARRLAADLDALGPSTIQREHVAWLLGGRGGARRDPYYRSFVEVYCDAMRAVIAPFRARGEAR